MIAHPAVVVLALRAAAVGAVLGSSMLLAQDASLRAETDGDRVLVKSGDAVVVTQHARPDFRPYVHPIVAPDGKGTLTEASPSHHRHQTGLYWGFTRLNGRDYFHHPEGTHWRRRAVEVVAGVGPKVAWRVEYDLLDEAGAAVLTENQLWTMERRDGRFLLDLTWRGTGRTEVKIGRYDYGGLFLRMPWREGIEAEVVNAARQSNGEAEGQRAPWLDVGMAIEGRDDLAHIAILDHPQNPGFPQPWRVDDQMGVGPVRARLGDWAIHDGETVEFKHRFVVYTGELDDLGVKNEWSRFTGRPYTGSLWGIARQEGRAAKFLTPEQAVDSMTLQAGFEASVWASEPMITQPMAFCWDDRGRMWVAENRDYESRSRGFANSGDSRILILEDTDRDGVADKRKVFLEGIPFPAAIAVGMGGLWLGAPPNLLFVPDADRDDRGDMDAIEVRLTGWGIRDRHETLNSLHWGPDGWLYGCQGFATPSKVGKPKDGGRLIEAGESFPKNIELVDGGTDINGGVWRYHPTKERFEVVAHGFSNPWGIDYDSKGRFFITACVIPHLWYIIPGGYYHRQGGAHFNAHVYEDIKTIVTHAHRSAHGGCRVYQSDAFPEAYRGRVFMANIHEHAVLTDVLTPVGSGVVSSRGDAVLKANNAQWIGFSVEVGPGGDLYVLDWHDADICGTDVLNKDTGRIFKVAPTESLATAWEGRFADLSTFGDAQLVALQKSPSNWHARRARILLQQRAHEDSLDEATRGSLLDMFTREKNADHRLRAMWALHVIGGLTVDQLQIALEDSDPHVRAWSVRFLADDLALPAVVRRRLEKRFARLALTDSSPVVRLELASVLRRVYVDDRWDIAQPLAMRSADASDHNLPKMIWFGIEPAVAKNPRRALEFVRSVKMSQVVRWTARRLVAAGQTDSVLGLVAEDDVGAWLKTALLNGVLDGLQGRERPKAPGSWPAARRAMEGVPGSFQLVTEIATRFGDDAAVVRLLGILSDRSLPGSRRMGAIRSLARERRPELEARLVELLDDAPVRREAIRSVAAFDDASLSEAVLSRYARFDPNEKLDVVIALAARPASGRALTEAIRQGSVPKSDVPAYVARQLRRVVGNSFVDVWGAIDALSADKEAQFAKYRALLTDEAVAQADPRAGRIVFQKTCAACHRMFGVGGQIGPDITGSNRRNLDYLLGNVLDPSAEMQDAYRMVIVTTRDGRTHAGTLASEDDRQLSLRVVGIDEPVVLPKAKISARDTVPVSMMPEGLLATLKDQEVLDLVAYLRADEQVELPGRR